MTEHKSIHDAGNYIFNEGLKRASDDKFDEAIGVYNNLIDLFPLIPAALNQRGRCNWEMHRWDEALRDFNEAARLSPGNHDVAWTLGLMNLQLNNFKEGWAGYERRWASDAFKSGRLRTSKPQWDMDSNAKKVLVWCEQGIGDQIIYSSLLNRLRDDVEVTAMVDARLVGPLSRGLPDIKFISHDTKISMDEHDAHIPIASLGSYFIHSLDDIECLASRNYIKDDWRRTAQVLRDHNLMDEDYVVGLSWNSTAKVVGEHKSCTLKDLEPVLEWGAKNNVKFLSLQYGKAQDDANAYPQIIQPQYIDTFFDLNGVCSMLYCCDQVVSVSNANVHLAGAMGVPVHLLDANKLWYWNNRRGRQNLWYPSVKIYPREHMLAPWDKQIAEVLTELETQHEYQG